MQLSQKKFLTDDEITQLLKNLKTVKNQLHVMAVKFALYTGARSAEVLEVTTSDLHANGSVYIIGKKNSNDKTVPLPRPFFERLRKYAKTLPAGSKLFPIKTRMFRHIWALVTPNKEKSLHCLRHTMGVKLYNNCEDVHAVKTVMGHKAISSSMRYLEFVESNKKLKSSIKGMWSNKLDSVS